MITLASALSKTHWNSHLLMMLSPASALKNREIFGALPMSQAIDSATPYTLKRALKTSQYSDMPPGTLRVTGLLMQHKPFHMIERKNTRLPPASQSDSRYPPSLEFPLLLTPDKDLAYYYRNYVEPTHHHHRLKPPLNFSPPLHPHSA